MLSESRHCASANHVWQRVANVIEAHLLLSHSKGVLQVDGKETAVEAGTVHREGVHQKSKHHSLVPAQSLEADVFLVQKTELLGSVTDLIDSHNGFLCFLICLRQVEFVREILDAHEHGEQTQQAKRIESNLVSKDTVQEGSDWWPKQQADSSRCLHVSDVLHLSLSTRLSNGREHRSLSQGVTVALDKSSQSGHSIEGLPVLRRNQGNSTETDGGYKDYEEAKGYGVLSTHSMDSDSMNLGKDNSSDLECTEANGYHCRVNKPNVVVLDKKWKESHYVIVLGATSHLS